MCMSNEQNPSFPRVFMATINSEHLGLTTSPCLSEPICRLPPDPGTPNPIPGEIEAAQGCYEIPQVWLGGEQVPVSSAHGFPHRRADAAGCATDSPSATCTTSKSHLKSVLMSTPRQTLREDLLVQAAHLTLCQGTYQCMLIKD